MSGPRMGISQTNGNSRRPPHPNVSRAGSNERVAHAQHDDLIKYIHESWSKVEMDRNPNSVMYYQDETAQHLKDFQPFDLESYWGRRKHQTMNSVKPHHS
ncbi:uncharacterized protein isoform X2 [Leptinotarsa decemlineata]|uniref:uncharacterized protein isoform X2 n=1 Tax=Leptinotarsa decemlineata TaxID=7539 RepID=UPI000C254B20|nr:uncharacterized protein LOC111505918 isoform X2 [Leptinotarsa decemlineata]